MSVQARGPYRVLPAWTKQPLVQAAPLRKAGSNLTQHFPKKKQHPGEVSRAGLILLVP